MLSWIKRATPTSARRQIAIKEVRDGILILPNNQFRLVVETSAINFELKSEAEQDVLIESYQSFLHSLPCALQLLVRVREVDIEQYVSRIGESAQSEPEPVYREQLTAYCQFIRDVVKGNTILSRRFYIVIPYQTQKSHDFSLAKEQLILTRDIITRGVERLGMRVKTLDTLEVLDLFYSFYNPAQSMTQELKAHAAELLSNTYV